MVANTPEPAAVHVAPQSTAEFISGGWVLKGEGKLDEAEKAFRQAIDLDPKSVEAYYGLGLALKAQDRRQECVKSFEKVLELIADHQVEDRIRAEMLKRLAQGHINQLLSGDWDLEKEIWKRK